jgi:hypothetical protein
MARYERYTAAPTQDVLSTAVSVLTSRIPIQKDAEDGHSIRLTGGDGTVTISAHRHGLDTLVVAETDQLRTSRIDVETQYFLNALPYQPGDVVHQPGNTEG